jgi:serine protease
MKKWRHLTLPALLVLLVAALAYFEHQPTAGVEQPLHPNQPLGPAAGAPGALLVDLVDDVTDEQIAELERRYNIDLRHNSVHSEEYELHIADVSEARIHTLVEQLRREPTVEVAERDGLYRTTGWFDYEPNDPSYQYQWHMDQIRMPVAWRLSRGRGAVVAVIDTGVAYADDGETYRQVPDLAQTRFVPGYDFVDDDEQPYDEHGHGTHVAGTIAQSTNNGIGVAGVAFEARIMPIRVLNRQGFGSYGDIADAIRWAADNGADVINMSLGGPIPSLAIWRAVRHARSKGVVVVAAAGNSGGRGVGYPGALSQVIGVSATRYDEELAWYSSWGPQVDIAAPGGDTRVDQNGDGMMDGVLQNTILPGAPNENDYLLFNGTSMASPHVAGVAALLVSQGITNPEAVERILERTARGEDRDPERYGAGIIDAASALRSVQINLGAIRLGLALALAMLLIIWLRRTDQLEVKPGVGMFVGLLATSSGLFFLPELLGAALPEPFMTLLSHSVLASDLALLGPGGHANPLFHSAILPVGLLLLLFGVKGLRPWIAGIALGAAAYLIVCSLWGTVDVTYLPYRFLDHAWLWINALVSLLVGVVSLRRGR